jgi:hypothetical protein
VRQNTSGCSCVTVGQALTESHTHAPIHSGQRLACAGQLAASAILHNVCVATAVRRCSGNTSVPLPCCGDNYPQHFGQGCCVSAQAATAACKAPASAPAAGRGGFSGLLPLRAAARSVLLPPVCRHLACTLYMLGCTEIDSRSAGSTPARALCSASLAAVHSMSCISISRCQQMPALRSLHAQTCGNKCHAVDFTFHSIVRAAMQMR